MSTYKNLIGKDVNFLTTDPDNNAAEGQIWYNSTSNVFKDLLTLNAWSNGGSLVTEHQDTMAAGTQTAGLCFGGSPPSGGIVATEEYNGSGWSTGGDMNTNRRGAARFSASTQTAGLVFGGVGPPNPTLLNATEEYNGTAWTSVNSLPAAKESLAGAGIQTAALSFGGYTSTAVATTEEYDGTNWTAGNAMSTAINALASAGIQTAALAFGGTPPGALAITEEYDGTNWTAGGDMNTARRYAAGCGTQDSALVFGAGPAAVVKTEKYDGTSWSETADMGIAQKNHGGAGSQSAALSCGGESPTNSRRVTQEFNNSTTVTTAAAWASGGALNTGRGYAGAATQGSQNSALHFGGWAPPTGARTLTEEYNGSTWSEQNDLGTAQYYVAGAGTQTAALGFGGYTTPPAAISAKTVEYDGSSWTNGGNLNNARTGPAGAGTQTAGLAMGGGNAAPLRTAVEEYNGSAWTNVNAKSNPTTSGAATGIQTAALSLGGPTVATELYDGTNWTSGGNMNVIRTSVSSATGTQTLGLIAKGNTPPGDNLITSSEKFDGTTFVTSASVTTGAQYACGTGATIAGVIHGGGTPLAGTNSTEEFTDSSSALNIKTITTS